MRPTFRVRALAPPPDHTTAKRRDNPPPCLPTRTFALRYSQAVSISPLPTASTHIHPDPVRTRKLLLKAEEIKKLIGKVERAGYTLMPLNLHYQRGRIKCEIGLAKGKKQHDKRDTERSRDADREIAKALKQNRR